MATRAVVELVKVWTPTLSTVQAARLADKAAEAHSRAMSGIPEPETRRTEIRLPIATIATVFAAGLLAYMAWTLFPLVMLLFLAALVAVTLHPIVDWLRARG